MADKVRVILSRPVNHDGVHYEPGDSLEMAADMAAALIGLGAAAEAPAEDRPTEHSDPLTPALSHEGRGGKRKGAA